MNYETPDQDLKFALEAAKKALEEQREVVRALESQFLNEQKKLDRIKSALDMMRSALSDSTESQRNYFFIKSQMSTLTPSMKEMMEIFLEKKTQPVRVQEVQEFLETKGHPVSSRYASNTLKKLSDRGLLTRIGRGRYKIGQSFLSIEGFSPSDYE